MKIWLFKQIFIIVLLTLMMFPQTSIGEDVAIPTTSIKIDNYLIYIIQQNDLKTFEIDEYFYINNTGNTSFNDPFYVWLPDNSTIVTNCCNATPNMACRNEIGGSMSCFYFNKTDDNNIYVGYPISIENKLSYYRQKESFTITAYSTTNISLKNDTLQLNATIGGSYISRSEDSFQGEGIHITSENQEIGMIPGIDTYESYNITKFEKIRVFNNGSDVETIELNISKLPEGWNAEIWNETNKLNNISLSPQKYENLTLIITAPSYLASIYVGVTVSGGIDRNEIKWSFINKYLYETKKVGYNIYSLTTEGLEVSKDLISVHEEPYWWEDYGRYWFFAKAADVQPNTLSTITIGLEKPPTQINPFIIGALVLILILILIVLILKKKDYFKEKGSSQKRETSSEKRKENLLEKKKALQELIERTETDQSSGLIDEKSAKKMKNDYQTQLDDLDKRLGEYSSNPKIKLTKTKNASKIKEKEIKDLEEKKKKVLSAIKRIEREFEDGTMSKENYERFREAYKKRAVDIFKEIDRLGKIEHE